MTQLGDLPRARRGELLCASSTAETDESLDDDFTYMELWGAASSALPTFFPPTGKQILQHRRTDLQWCGQQESCWKKSGVPAELDPFWGRKFAQGDALPVGPRSGPKVGAWLTGCPVSGVCSGLLVRLVPHACARGQLQLKQASLRHPHSSFIPFALTCFYFSRRTESRSQHKLNKLNKRRYLVYLQHHFSK